MEARDGHELTATIVEFALRRVVPSARIQQAVTRALIDTVGVARAATNVEAEPLVRTWALAQGSTGRATVWTSGDLVSPSTAALINATAAHVLDYDDISPTRPMHPSAVLLPAIMAVAQARSTDPQLIPAAYAVGAAVFRAVADELPHEEHYQRGWHTTSTVGRIAAVASLITLCRLTPQQGARALGVVSSLAAGTLANFGTMTKPLHAGLAARDAIMACELAEAGFTANEVALETDRGFFDLYGTDPGNRPEHSSIQFMDALEHWRVEWDTDWGIKRYPACYATHRALDAALKLRAEHDVGSARRVTVTVHPEGLRPLRTEHPQTSNEAKFTMSFVIATALLAGELRLRDFDKECLTDPSVLDLMTKITVSESKIPPWGPPEFDGGFAVVSLEMADGQTVRERADVTHGDSRSPLTDSELRAKFIDCCSQSDLSSSQAEELSAALETLLVGQSTFDQLHHALTVRVESEGMRP
jgi:2-methylcitrate dehydratase PrpD